MLVDGVEKNYAPDVPGAVYVETEQLTEQPCSFGQRGIEPYRAALAIGPDGIVKERSVTEAISGGSYDDAKAEGISIHSESDDFSGVVAIGGKYHLKNVDFNFDTKADGKNTCDFSGYGSLISAFKGSRVTIEDSKLVSKGVAKPALFSDDESHGLFKNCDVEVHGGRLYEGYVNSANQKTMVAPPWVLGISGNARGVNLEGSYGACTVVDTDFKSNQWGVLSTDSGTNMQLYVIDSKMTLMGKDIPESDKLDPYSKNYGSGYGTYIIGNAHEEFFGVDMKVGTMGAILRGGKATYQSSKGTITVPCPYNDSEVYYQGEGKGRNTTILSEAFGFMAHGDGVLTVKDGTEVNCADALFLLKSNGVNMVLDNCTVNTGSGVLVQMIDDDDSTVGMGNGGFNTDFYEKAGWPSENGQISSKMEKKPGGMMGMMGGMPPMGDMPGGPGGPGGMPGGPGEMPGGPGGMPGGPGGPGGMFNEPPKDYPTDACYFDATNVALKGDMFNGTGYYGQDAKKLVVRLGAGAQLDGAVSATETIHVNEKGEQNTHFTIKEFYYLGHVANRNFFNGDNFVEVELADGAVWNVTGEGVITALTVGEGCTFNGKAYMDGQELAIEPGKKYEGVITVK